MPHGKQNAFSARTWAIDRLRITLRAGSWRHSRRLPKNPLGSLFTIYHSRSIGVFPSVLLIGLRDRLHSPLADFIDTNEVRFLDSDPVLSFDTWRRPSSNLILGVVNTRSNKSGVVNSSLTLPQTNGSLHFEGFNEHMTKFVTLTAPSLLESREQFADLRLVVDIRFFVHVYLRKWLPPSSLLMRHFRYRYWDLEALRPIQGMLRPFQQGYHPRIPLPSSIESRWSHNDALYEQGGIVGGGEGS